MAESTISLEFGNGIRHAHDQKRLPPGFSERIEGAYYVPEDEDQLHKLFGRTVALDSSEAPKGIVHLQFDGADGLVLIYKGTTIYRATAVQGTLGTLTSLKDAQTVPVAYSRTGTFLKAIPATDNRWIVWTGAINERPLLVDSTGRATRLGMRKPNTKVTNVAKLLSPLVAIRPDAGTQAPFADPTYGNVTQWFNDVANAYDGDDFTCASKSISAAGIVGSDFTFTDAGLSFGHTLSVTVATSSLPPTGDRDSEGGKGGGATESFTGRMIIRLAHTTLGSVFSTVYEGPAPLTKFTFKMPLTVGLAWTGWTVRVLFIYSKGTTQVIPQIYEIYAAQNSQGGSTAYGTSGKTFTYLTTEVAKINVNGQIYEIESASSDPVTSPQTGVGDTYGFSMDLPAFTNLDVEGFGPGDDGIMLFKRIYRSGESGVWPDVGMVGEVPSTATTFSDGVLTTAVPEIPLYTLPAGVAVYDAAGEPPDFYDATLWRGSVVAIPAGDRARIKWALPGQPNNWIFPQDLKLLPSLRNDTLSGVVTVNDKIILLTRSRAIRLNEVPFAGQVNEQGVAEFDLSRVETDVLSPNVGLVGGPKSYALFEAQNGHALLAWVSDNGIWMTDGSLVSERGMGVVKLSVNMDWANEIDKARLSEARLTYDPDLQILFFDAWFKNTRRQTMLFHTHPLHFIDSGQNQQVPKATGPHETRSPLDRAIGEAPSGGFWHWSLAAPTSSTTRAYNERFGTDDAGRDIQTHIESGWGYPAGARGGFHIMHGSVYHTDWGPSESCTLDLLARDDSSGTVRVASKRGISLMGDRVTDLGFLNIAGQSLKAIIRHLGKTTTPGTKPNRAFGPIGIEGIPLAEAK